MSTFKPDPSYDALSPQSAKGDLAVYGAAGSTRFPAGANGLFLKADSTQPLGLSYAAPAGSVLSVATLAGATALTTGNDVVLVSGTTFAITLFDATANVGKVLRIKKTDAGFVTPISINGSTTTQTIDGFAGITLATINEMVELTSGPSFWHITEHFVDPNIGALSVTPQSFGATNAIYMAKRVANRLQMKGYWITTATGASVACLGIPAGIVASSSFIIGAGGTLTTHVGNWYSHDSASYGSANTAGPLVMSGASLGTMYLSGAGSVLGANTQNTNAASIFGVTPNAVSFSFEIEVTGWKG